MSSESGCPDTVRAGALHHLPVCTPELAPVRHVMPRWVVDRAWSACTRLGVVDRQGVSCGSLRRSLAGDTSNRKAYMKFIVTALCLTLLTPALASANTISAVNRAAQVEGLQPATTKLDVVETGNQLRTATNGISLGVPNTKITAAANGTVVNGVGHSKVVFQKAGGEYRASVQIADENDPESYEFDVTGAASLIRNDDGSVSAVDLAGKPLAWIAPAWARDRNGKVVPTHYEIAGSKLVQVVKHKGMGFAYGITADPGFWEICACAGAIVWVVGTNLIVPWRLVKLKQTIHALGGAWNAAKLSLRATHWHEKLRVFGEAGAGAAAEFFGVKQIRDNC